MNNKKITLPSLQGNALYTQTGINFLKGRKAFFFYICAAFFTFTTVDCAKAHDCEAERAGFVSTRPGSGHWLEQDFPKRGWKCIKMRDLGRLEDQEPEAKICEMCETERIRYAHVMSHTDHDNLTVGCICAGHLEGDADAAQRRHTYFKSWKQKRDTWLDKWKIGADGRPYITTRQTATGDRHYIVIRRNAFGYYAGYEPREEMWCGDWRKSMDRAKYDAFAYLYQS